MNKGNSVLKSLSWNVFFLSFDRNVCTWPGVWIFKIFGPLDKLESFSFRVEILRNIQTLPLTSFLITKVSLWHFFVQSFALAGKQKGGRRLSSYRSISFPPRKANWWKLHDFWGKSFKDSIIWTVLWDVDNAKPPVPRGRLRVCQNEGNESVFSSLEFRWRHYPEGGGREFWRGRRPKEFIFAWKLLQFCAFQTQEGEKEIRYRLIYFRLDFKQSEICCQLPGFRVFIDFFPNAYSPLEVNITWVIFLR